jgi:exoribonuclease R
MELNIADRNYDKWTFTSANGEPIRNITINPLTSKLFHGDIINMEGQVTHSPYRENNDIPGVLILTGKTYGKTPETGHKLLYKCVPNEPTLPCFLIPYEEKIPLFNKNKYNKYITFKNQYWRDKHPIGQVTNSFGEVTNEESYYQYQLCCKGLNQSLTAFNKATLLSLNGREREKIGERIMLKLIPLNVKTEFEDRRLEPIFSIDPPGCKDIDDAIGLKIIADNTVIISIYIANVALILDYLQLWSHFSERVSTIYLPTSRLPMLPTNLADDLCSLLQGKDRWTYCLDLYLTDTVITKMEFKKALIKVQKNYVYEEDALLKNNTYIQLLATTKLLVKQYKYVENIQDSHDLVEFYMIFMNYESAKRLREKGTGIFRTAKKGEETDWPKSSISSEMRKFLQAYKVTNCNYCTHANIQPHDLIGEGLESYVHITSPIRRLVDLINQIELQGDCLSAEAKAFSANWLKKIDYINKTMKAIRKVQNNCTLLNVYLHQKRTNYTGLLFNKMDILSPGEYRYKFSIYIPALKMVTTIKTKKILDNYMTVVVSAYSFLDEDNIMKKIRLAVV